MEENEKGPWWTSSEDPLKLSLTIRGMLVLYIPFLLALASSFNFPLTESNLYSWITQISFMAGGVMFLWGVYRKVKNWLSR